MVLLQVEKLYKDDCGFNAIWPQGGAWIFDRANWCPGEAVPIFNHEITPYITAGDSATFDINFVASILVTMLHIPVQFIYSNTNSLISI